MPDHRLMPGLTHLKNVRAGHKGVITKKLVELGDALNNTPINNDDLKQLKLTLQDKFHTISKNNDEIVALLTEADEIAAEIAAGDELKDSLRAALSKLDRAVGSTRADTSLIPPTVAPPTGSRSACRVRLPELTLSHFDGTPTKWRTFWDTYESAIHNPDLPDINKFTYLRSLLHRSAKDAIAGLSLTAVNYSKAIDIYDPILENHPYRSIFEF